MADWVAAFLGVTHESATRMVRVARKLQCLPHMGEAYSEGRLSWDNVRFLCRVATPETEARLAEDALGMTAADVEVEVRRVLRARRLESMDQNTPATHVRSRSDPDARGTWFWGFLSEGDDVVVIDELERRATEAGERPENRAPFDERMGQALVEACREEKSGRSRPLTTVIHVGQPSPGSRFSWAEIPGGSFLDETLAERLSCRSCVQWVYHNAKGNPVGIGRRSQSPPEWLQRLVRRRDDNRCRFPGCRRHRMVDCHHLRHWARDGGRTDLDNILLLCEFHHTLVHSGGWTIRGDPNGEVEFIRPGGRPLGDAGDFLKRHPRRLRARLAVPAGMSSHRPGLIYNYSRTSRPRAARCFLASINV